MYIAAPISIFMIIWGAYLFITSAGDEERVKKGKSILINTGIALIILLAGLSFMTDIVTFQL
jgi:Type IV secretion system pilin